MHTIWHSDSRSFVESPSQLSWIAPRASLSARPAQHHARCRHPPPYHPLLASTAPREMHRPAVACQRSVISMKRGAASGMHSVWRHQARESTGRAPTPPRRVPALRRVGRRMPGAIRCPRAVGTPASVSGLITVSVAPRSTATSIASSSASTIGFNLPCSITVIRMTL